MVGLQYVVVVIDASIDLVDTALALTKSTKVLAEKQKISKIMTPFIHVVIMNEPHCEKNSLWGFRPGQTQTGLYNHIRRLEA